MRQKFGDIENQIIFTFPKLAALTWQFVAVILQRLSKEGRCNFLFCIIMSKLHLAFKKMADDLELRSQVVRISCEGTSLSHRAQNISSLLGYDTGDAVEIINMPLLDFAEQIDACAKEKIEYLAKL